MTTLREAVIVAVLAVAGMRTTVDGARILAVETLGGKSHWNFMSGVLRALVDGGHTVTAFTPYPDGDRENYTEVDVSGDYEHFLDLGAEYMRENFGRPFALFDAMMPMSRNFCDTVYGNAEMKNVLDRGTGYDLVLIEPMCSECVSYAAARLNVPLVYVVALPTIDFIEYHATGHLSNPGSVSNLMAHYSVPRTFTQRLYNTIMALYFWWVRDRMESELKRSDPKPYDGTPSVLPSLIFVNRHYVSDAPRPTLPNTVDVGGIHLKAAKPLPEDVLKFIEQSPSGVIFLTLGSTIAFSTLPEHIQQSFKEAIEQIPQRVLMKYEGEMENKPKNVMIRKWLPQREILLHPNVKLFISHGGISGLYEAVEAGIPILGFPIMADQFRNIEYLVDARMAISMDLLSLSKDTFLKNVLELLNNQTYTKNAKIASEIFKDRPKSPQELVVFWTEYVLRHKGAPHLKSQALNLKWYQYLLLDIVLRPDLRFTVLRLISDSGVVNFKLSRDKCSEACRELAHLVQNIIGVNKIHGGFALNAPNTNFMKSSHINDLYNRTRYV